MSYNTVFMSWIWPSLHFPLILSLISFILLYILYHFLLPPTSQGQESHSTGGQCPLSTAAVDELTLRFLCPASLHGFTSPLHFSLNLFLISSVGRKKRKRLSAGSYFTIDLSVSGCNNWFLSNILEVWGGLWQPCVTGSSRFLNIHPSIIITCFLP